MANGLHSRVITSVNPLRHEGQEHDDKHIHYDHTLLCRFFVPNILILKEPITVELFFMQAKILIFKVVMTFLLLDLDLFNNYAC